MWSETRLANLGVVNFDLAPDGKIPRTFHQILLRYFLDAANHNSIVRRGVVNQPPRLGGLRRYQSKFERLTYHEEGSGVVHQFRQMASGWAIAVCSLLLLLATPQHAGILLIGRPLLFVPPVIGGDGGVIVFSYAEEPQLWRSARDTA